MTKSKLIICLSVLLLFLSYTICYATSDIDMNLLSNSISNSNTNSNTNTNTDSNTNTSNTITEDEEDTIYEDEEDETYTSSSAHVSSTTYTDSDELKIGDMINICLIVVGVLLILLSIAILIRLKN